jgi:hypothetical protein
MARVFNQSTRVNGGAINWDGMAVDLAGLCVNFVCGGGGCWVLGRKGHGALSKVQGQPRTERWVLPLGVPCHLLLSVASAQRQCRHRVEGLSLPLQATRVSTLLCWTQKAPEKAGVEDGPELRGLLRPGRSAPVLNGQMAPPGVLYSLLQPSAYSCTQSPNKSKSGGAPSSDPGGICLRL